MSTIAVRKNTTVVSETCLVGYIASAISFLRFTFSAGSSPLPIKRNKSTNERTKRWMDGWMDQRMDGWIDGWMDG